MTSVQTRNNVSSRAQTVAFCGLTVALMVVSAWFTIPIGIVPVTLQVFVMVFALLFLSPGRAIASIGAYLLLGACGLPVFSGMRGGFGVLLGPTGGFLFGYLLGGLAALAVLAAFDAIVRSRGLLVASQAKASGNSLAREAKMPAGLRLVRNGAAAATFLLVIYVCGWFQLMLVAGMTPGAAFLAGVAPFVVIDVIKALAAITLASAVKQGIRR
ncbi:MAG: biotin transporter BioY [Coriobacteriaceae bacterium]|nr:biotin transporter BioY [Coriobacteriaceae bacterium]